jgi:hypothetical protein
MTETQSELCKADIQFANNNLYLKFWSNARLSPLSCQDIWGTQWQHFWNKWQTSGTDSSSPDPVLFWNRLDLGNQNLFYHHVIRQNYNYHVEYTTIPYFEDIKKSHYDFWMAICSYFSMFSVIEIFQELSRDEQEEIWILYASECHRNIVNFVETLLVKSEQYPNSITRLFDWLQKQITRK